MLRASDDGDEIGPSTFPSQVRRTASLDSQPQLELINENSQSDPEGEEDEENGYSSASPDSWVSRLWQTVNPYAVVPQQDTEFLQPLGRDDAASQAWPDESKQSWISLLLFTWLTPLVDLGMKRPLQHSDLYQICEDDSGKVLCDDFELFWQAEQRRAGLELREPSLPRAIWARYGRRYLVMFVLMVVWTVAYGILSPLLVNAMLTFVSSPNLPIFHGFIIAFGLAASTAIQAVSAHRFYFRTLRLGVNVRSTLICLLYRKALRASATVRGKGVGEVLTLMSNDVDKLLDFFWVFPLGLCSILQYVGCTFLLWYFIGWAGLAGAVSFLLLVPLNHFFATRVTRSRYDMLKQTDKRVKWTAEILQGIKMVKLYSYEQRFLEYLLGIRQEEMTHLRKLCFMKEFNTAAVHISPTLLTALTFFAYAFGGPLTPAIAFTVLSLFSTLRVSVRFVPQVMSLTAECSVSVARMQKFLALPIVAAIETPLPPPEMALTFDNASYRWEEDGTVALHSLNLAVRRGELLAVIGPVGAGKSTLLQAVLNELPFCSGRMTRTSGSLGYVPQQAWIFNGSVRSNILFGQTFDVDKYHAVVASCALLPDLALLPGGDEAEIGERGAALSGGQKLRVCLARALYAAPELLLLDDPLSAVDSHVGRHLFKTICDFTKSTRILVTHQLYTLRRVDRVLVLEGGRIAALAPLRDLSPELMKRLGLEEDSEQDSKPPLDGEGDAARGRAKLKESTEGHKTVADKPAAAPVNSLMEAEERQQGSVSLHVYSKYLAMLGGPWFCAGIASLFVGAQVVAVASDTWLANWSTNPQSKPLHVWLSVYMTLAGLWGLFLLARALSIVIAGLNAAKVMHETLAYRVLHAPLLFFNSTPVGRIINRFSKDTQNIDEATSATMHQFLLWACNLISAMLVIVVVSPPLLIGLPPIIYLYLRFQRRFRDSCRELKRLDSISKSPIFQSFTETLAGLEVIRAFKRQGQVRLLLEDRMDRNVRPYFLNLVLNRWLAVRLELLGSMIVLATTVAVVLQRNTRSAGYLGFMLSSALLVVGSMNAFIRWMTDVEIQMNSVERVLHYSQLPQEAPAEIAETKPATIWPSAGRIDIEDLHLRYRDDLPAVLHGITCEIGAGEKIGVVGRTGAGKSSLVLALFRLCEPHKGLVRVDGIDISTLGLADLRSRLSIIPQDPVLFTGTVRSNLDPFNTSSDSDVWEALRRVRMRDCVSALEGQLDAKVEENGVNFSVGQRQLVCLARALIKRARVLVLDEATASIDPPTDALIQATIRSEFADCTVIAIAHRLATVLDADKVLVLDRGRVAEFGTPKALLSNPRSRFAGLVAAQNEPL